jgi:hypothetical protein
MYFPVGWCQGGEEVKERQFDDDYTLCQRIGKGAFAEVYMCVQKVRISTLDTHYIGHAWDSN